MYENVALLYGDNKSLTPTGSTFLIAAAGSDRNWRLKRVTYNVTMAKTGAIVSVTDAGTVLRRTPTAANAADQNVIRTHDFEFDGDRVTKAGALMLLVSGGSATANGKAVYWEERQL